MTTGNIVLLLAAILSIFVYPPAFFILGMIAAFNFITKNLSNTTRQIENLENPSESDASPTQITYHYLQKYRNEQKKPVLIPRIETADLTHLEKREWQNIVDELSKEK
jgi:hypothetical protein